MAHLECVGHLIVSFAHIGYNFNFAKSHIAHLAVLFLGYELNNEGRGLAPHFFRKICTFYKSNHTQKITILAGLLKLRQDLHPRICPAHQAALCLDTTKFSTTSWLPVHTAILQSSLTDLLATNFLLTRDNHTNLVIRIVPGVVGFTYLTFNEGDTVPIQLQRLCTPVGFNGLLLCLLQMSTMFSTLLLSLSYLCMSTNASSIPIARLSPLPGIASKRTFPPPQL